MTRYRHLITDENRKWWTLGAMCFALFMIMLDNTVVNVALPSIQRDLGASISGLEWTINGYTLSFAVLLATGGRLGDIFGRRRMFLFGVVIFALSSATAGLARAPTDLVVSRVVQGVGAALMMPGTLSIITDAFPAHERGKAMGTWAGVSALALAVGPVLGGFLTEHVSWRAIFYLNIPVAIGAVTATLFAVRESRDTTRRPRGRLPRRRDPDRRPHRARPRPGRGQQLGLGLDRDRRPAGRRGRWRWPAFVAIELRVKAPMVEFRFFADRNFLGAVVVALIITFAMMGVFFFLALYMQNILRYSPLEAGVRFLPSTLMIVGVAPVAGRLADRFGPRWLIAAGLLLAHRLALQLHRHRGRLRLPRPAARLHAARHRHRADDVADDQRRDERGRGPESRHRLRRPLDVPHGRRQPRHRRHRRDLPGRRPAAASRRPTPAAVRRRPQQRDGGLRRGHGRRRVDRRRRRSAPSASAVSTRGGRGRGQSRRLGARGAPRRRHGA